MKPQISPFLRSKNLSSSSSSMLLPYFLSLLVFQSLPLNLEARTIVHDAVINITDAPVDLNSTNFEKFLKKSPANFAIVEFFAHWCPACRNYKPHYEKVAKLFNGPKAVHPGIVLMTRVDCADKVNTNLCDRFSVGHYPMLLWAPPIKFADGRWDPKEEESGIQSIDDGRTAERLLNWINEKIGSSFSLDDVDYDENSLPRNGSNTDQIVQALYDVEEATANAFDIIVENKMIKSDTRVPLLKFFQLTVAHHPSKRCQRGIAELLVNFEDLWPKKISSDGLQIGKSHGKEALQNFWICGKEVPRGNWIFCRGSKNETRGFSCGLWVLLHSLTVRAEDKESHLAFTVICEFVQNFFVCDECRMHFGQMCSSVVDPFNSTRDLSLWLWTAHNKVNVRLMKEEKDLGTGDSKFPKIIWPPKHLCPSYYAAQSSKRGRKFLSDWNHDEVFKFLARYYGETLVSSHKGETTKSLNYVSHNVSMTKTLLVVAALLIAVVSCTLGGLACFWSTQHSNRKYMHQVHSLKNI